MRRREFLRSTVGCVPLACGWPLLISGSSLGATETAPSERVTLGFIGLGWKGFEGCWGSLLQSFIREPGAQVLAVCDVDRRYRDRAKAYVDAFYGRQDCAAYNDFREVLARPDIDAVVIATPDHWHAAMTIMACQQGKDVYCEKPLSLTIREARAMVQAARRYNRVVQTGSQSRANPNIRRACELIRDGCLGRINEVFVTCGPPSVPCPLPGEPVPDYLDWDLWLGPAPWRPYHPQIHPVAFRVWQDYSGGGMTDWGAHHFDLVQWALGMDQSGPVEIIPPDGKEGSRLTFRYANGAQVYHSGYNQDEGVRFVGSDGQARLYGVVCRAEFDSAELNRQLTEKPITGDDLFGNRGHYADFLHCIRTRRKPAADAETGCRTVTVCHLGNIAHALQRPLKWDPAHETFPGDAEANRHLSRTSRAPWQM